MLSQDEKLDEALKGTFPASDAFHLAPDDAPDGRPGTPTAVAASNVAERKE